MDIKSGQAESHPTPLSLDTSHSPGVVRPTPVFPSETGRDGTQGGVLADTSGVDFTADAAAAMHAGMAADADRRGRYATGMSPLGASYGDDMALPTYGTGEATVAGSWFDPPPSGTPVDSA
jgi:hypothetical protein